MSHAEKCPDCGAEIRLRAIRKFGGGTANIPYRGDAVHTAEDCFVVRLATARTRIAELDRILANQKEKP